MKNLCVFCGSSAGAKPIYASVARGLGRELAMRGVQLIFGGGRVGLMGEVAAASLAADGKVLGVIPQALSAKEIALAECTELIIVDTMHQRKALMADRADAFAALPGGYGTCDELFEILTWAQLGIHCKPVGLLNVNDFFTPLLGWLNHATSEGFLKTEHRELLIVAGSTPELLDKLNAWRPKEQVEKWVEPGER